MRPCTRALARAARRRGRREAREFATAVRGIDVGPSLPVLGGWVHSATDLTVFQLASLQDNYIFLVEDAGQSPHHDALRRAP